MLLELTYHNGLIEVQGGDAGLLLPHAVWNAAKGVHKILGCHYAALVLHLRDQKILYTDKVRAYQDLKVTISTPPSRDYQKNAIASWIKTRGQGVVVLPTGAGKTHVALLAIKQFPRSTLVLVPTLELVKQWRGLLQGATGLEIGMLGGGEHNILPITVSTYDSAAIHMKEIGNKFGLMIFDECHHLPSAGYALAAEYAIAPFRLGLTATLERQDGLHETLTDLVGPTVYEQEITDLSGSYLAPYETRTIYVRLNEQEKLEYEHCRNIYRAFTQKHQLRPQDGSSFKEFIFKASRSNDGKVALAAYYKQKRIAFAAEGKMDKTEELLMKHAHDRAILFTNDNATCYAMAKRLLIPAITHHTKSKERDEILGGLREHRYSAIITSKVLNEGIDVPDANVAIVISGTGSIREHVQRLGRILRMKDGKRAVLYELVTEGTGETFTSERRKEHDAYRT